MCFSSTGVLAVAGFDKHIRLYDSNLKTLLFSIAIPAPATALSFREDLIAVATTNSAISLIEADVNQNSFEYHARYETSESHTTALLLCPSCVPLTEAKPCADDSPKREVDPLSQTFSDVESFLSRLPPLPPDKQAKQEHASNRLHQRRSLPLLSKQSTDLDCEEVRAAQLPAHLSASFLTDEQRSPPSSAGTASPVSRSVSRKNSQDRQADIEVFEGDCSAESSPLLQADSRQEAPLERRKAEEFLNIGAPVLRKAGVKAITEGEEENESMNMFRSILRQEMDVIRTDLHHDIVSIHSELVLLASSQSRELKQVLKERDETVMRLEKEVRRLKADNVRLRRKYGL
ncbi:WD40/YVTN repeat-like containing protein [Gracilaria domingensis]|nr:WD40/YVTN repeat-like containing protein [Gracilaria domingensis]